MSNYYEKDGFKLARVTAIISDCTDKSAALMGWVAKCYRQYMEECIVDYEDADQSVIPFGTLRELLDNGKKEYRNVSKEALDIGSAVHDYIERFLKNGVAQIEGNEQVAKAVEAFHEWEASVDLKPISIEKTVYGNGWAGTLDFLGYMNGKLYVIDWKSSKAIYPEMRYQIAAYRFGEQEEISRDCWMQSKKSPDPMKTVNELIDYNKIEGCGILRLDKETGLPTFKDTSKSYESDLEIFNRMVDLYFARHPRIRKKAGRE